MASTLKLCLLVLFSIGIGVQTIQAQYATKKVKSKHEAYTDSIKQMDYPYVFPIFGQQTYQKGFDIPYPAGLMANFIWLKQGITIDNLQLGLFKESADIDIPLTDVGFIKFGENQNTSWSTNVRPDLWIFPFLNVYGIFGVGRSETKVNIVEPLQFTSIVEQSIKTAGVGVLGAFGIGPAWLTVDGTFTWSYPELLDDPVNVNVAGLRLGKTFTNKTKPTRNFAVWVGAQYMSMSTETKGQIQLQDALPPEVWENKDDFVQRYTDWYNSLDPTKPLDQKKIEKADEVLTPIVERIDALDGSAIVRYGMEKQVQQNWNGVIGAQYQLNKNWQLRVEGGIIGNRKSALASLNYRFRI